MTEVLKLPERKRTFRYLAGLYETNTDRILKASLEVDAPNEATDIISSGALAPDGLAYEIPIDTTDGIQWLDVIEREPGVFTCYCASEGFIEITEEQQRQYFYDLDWLIKVLKSHLKLTGDQITVVPTQLEWLGNLRVDEQLYQVLLARHLTSMGGYKSIYQGLDSWSGKGAGVILTVPERYDHLLPLPGGYPVVSVMSLLSSESPCRIESKKLKEFLRATFQPDAGKLEVRWECYGIQGRFKADNREPWDIRGEKRCGVTSLIYDAWLAGNAGITTDQLNEEGFKVTHPGNCYNDHRWKDYIRYENKLWSIKAERLTRRRSSP
ncbi:hypothetical protein NX722_03865 [Endozoicomonas gorgoniicola]|uniref:Uncharacterized protein n=1 Tax=Endozoicomonas gorgoniicola TaxID=1234144 RepID=A0ABT3MRN2_9GAMM|nr:hypothetical protein [Endozoicomonas gorgoniicola]MCW7551788.1 hypothetical protein [Endozoicomonas gorgoniicola]